MKRFLSLILALVCLLSALPVTYVQAADYAYNPEKAAAYAEANWDTDDGTVCDQFVKNSLAAGGVTIRAGDVEPVRNALIQAKFGTAGDLTIASDGIHINKADNPKLKAGDVMFYYCPQCEENFHTVMVGGFTSEGNAYIYGHNPNDYQIENFGLLGHNADNGERHVGFSYSAVHMDTTSTTHQHNFKTDLLETAHPHKMYDKCSDCGVSYYLGWNGKKTICPECNPPQGDTPVVTAVYSDGTVKLSWSTVYNASGYNIYRATSKNGTYTKLNSSLHTSSATYTNPSFEPGVTYYYRVDGVLTDGSVAASDVVSLTIPGGIAAPVLSAREHAAGKPSMKWTQVPGAAKYELYKAVKGEDFELYKTIDSSSISYTNEGAVGGFTYEFKVRAVMEDGSKGTFSNTVTFDVPVETPVLEKKSHESGKPSMKWTQVFGATGYRVLRTDVSTGETVTYKVSASSLSFTNSSAPAGKTYEYKVRAVMENGYSNYSNAVTFVLEPEKIEADPPVLKAYGKTNSAKPKITWNQVNGAVKYEIHYILSGSSTYSKLTDTTSRTYVHESADAGCTYQYKVRALLSDGSYTDFSNVKSVVCYPSKPTMSSQVVANGKPRLVWTDSSGAGGYLVYYRVSGTSTWKKLIQKTETFVNHIGAAAGTTYEYYVKAYAKTPAGKFVYSSDSNIVTVTAEDGVPKLSSRTIASGKPSMTWEDVDGATGYLVYYRVKGSGSSYKKLIQKTGTFVNHIKATSGTTYQYYVKAFTKLGSGQFIYSKPSNVISIKAK